MKTIFENHKIEPELKSQCIDNNFFLNEKLKVNALTITLIIEVLKEPAMSLFFKKISYFLPHIP